MPAAKIIHRRAEIMHAHPFTLLPIILLFHLNPISHEKFIYISGGVKFRISP